MILDDMWDRLAQHQPYADQRGYGPEWAKMCAERTSSAARAAWAAASEAEAAAAARAAARAAAAAWAARAAARAAWAADAWASEAEARAWAAAWEAAARAVGWIEKAEGGAESDARLIAAAPDLLAALRDLLSGWMYIREVHGDLYGVGWDRAQEKALAAIAKAGGRE